MRGRYWERTWLSAALLLVAALWAGAVRAQSPKPLEVVVAVPGPASTVSLPVELMPRLGLDAEQGLRVRPFFVNGGGVALEELISRNADFAVLGLPAAMLMRSRDPGVVALAAIDDLPRYVLIVREDLRAAVRQVGDLRRRVLGVHSDSLAAKTTSHLLTELVLAGHGVPPDAVRYVLVGQNWQTQSAAFAAKTVDAIMADEAFASRFIAEKRGFALLNLADPAEAQRIPGSGFLRATLIGRAEMVRNDPDRVARMVRVVKAALAWIASRPPQQAIAAAGFADPAATATLTRLLQENPRMYSRDGRFSTRQLRETGIFFHAANPLDRAAQALQIESMIVDRWAGRVD